MGVITEREQVEALFAALAADRIEEFLAGCSEQLLITVWGSSPLSSTVCLDQLRRWWEGFNHLAGGTLETEVLLTLPDEPSQVIILRHRFFRDGTARTFDTVNFCTLRDGALIAWFSSPLDRREYAEAWGLPGRPVHPRRAEAWPRVTAPRGSDDLERR
jgi:hypothetical protein